MDKRAVVSNRMPVALTPTKARDETLLTDMASSVESSEQDIVFEDALAGSGSSRNNNMGDNEKDKSTCRRLIVFCLLAAALILVTASIVLPIILSQHHSSSATSAQQQDRDTDDALSIPTLGPRNQTSSIDETDDQTPVNIPDGDDTVATIIVTSAPTPAPFTYATAPTTTAPLSFATPAPTPAPISDATPAPVAAPFAVTSNISTFYVIGDVPYNEREATGIRAQMQLIPEDAEFIVHVGDLRNAGRDLVCNQSEYYYAEELFRLSRVPVFMLLGDNEWNDCPNPEEGLMYWQNIFVGFESKYWNHPFNVTRLTGYPETFAFKWKNTLYIGLQLVGGDILDATEWSTRLLAQAEWTKSLINDYRASKGAWDAGRVVLFGHADPNRKHRDFFQTLTNFIQYELYNSIPIVYICGDSHRWELNSSWYDQPSLQRIMVTGGSTEPPLKLVIDGNGLAYDPASAFIYDRQLSNLAAWNITNSNVSGR